jgi:raffinose/stachyose/melibiose transport system substrate-binding protein
MKKCMELLFVLVLIVFIISFGVGCKATTVETTAAETKAVETTAQATTAVETTTEKDIFAEPTKLVFWWYGEDEAPGFTKYIESICAEYNKLHPNIIVTPIHQGMDAVIPNFLAAAAAKSGPDIATMWGGLYQLEQVWAGNIAPISDYVGEEEMGHWPTKGISEYDGKVWASDIFALGFPLAYNTEHFNDAGLDPEKPPVTWEEFIEASGKLKAAGHEPFVAGWKGGYQFVVLGSNFLFQYMSVNDVKEAVVGIKKFTDPGWVNTFEKIDEYNRAGYFIEASMSIDQAQAWPEWRSGAGTFGTLSSPLILTFMEEEGANKFKIMPFPKITDKVLKAPPIFVFSQFITAWSQNKELAADFLVFLHSEESFQKMIETVGGKVIPVDDRFDTNLIEDPVRREVAVTMMEGYKEDIIHVDEYLPYAITGESICSIVQQLILKEVTPQEAAASVEASAEEWRSQNPEYVQNYEKWLGIK